MPSRLAEIDRTQPVAVYCHHGMRSRMVGAFLLQEGFTEVWNLNGGIDAWAAAVDPAMARY